MPGGDRTGPLGMGPMTGRGAGYCAGYSVPGFGTRGVGRGGFGGGGRGCRNRFYVYGFPRWNRFGGNYGGPYETQLYNPRSGSEQELSYLKDQEEYFQKTLDDLKERIEKLEKDAKKQ